MDHGQLDLNELRELTAGVEGGGFSLADILADYSTNSEFGMRNSEFIGPSGTPAPTPKTSDRAVGADAHIRPQVTDRAPGPRATDSRPYESKPPVPQKTEFSIDDILADFYAGEEQAEPVRRERSRNENETKSVKHRPKKNRTRTLAEPETAVGADNIRPQTGADPQERADPPGDLLLPLRGNSPRVGIGPYEGKPAVSQNSEFKTPNSELDSPSFNFKRKSSLPSEAEIRAFVADYTRDEADRDNAPSGEAEIDPRFHLGGQRPGRRELRYDGHSVDLGVAEGYVPPEAPEYVSSYAPEEPDGEDDEETPDEAPRLGFLNKLRRGFQRERGAYLEKEQARRAALEKKPELKQTREMTLPGEEDNSELSVDPDATKVFTREETEPVNSEFEIRNSESKPSQSRGRHEAKTAAKPQKRAVESDVPYEEKPDDTDNSEFITPNSELDYTPAWTRKLANHRPYASAFPDTSANPAVYAPQSDYEYDDALDDEERAQEGAALLEEEAFFPPTFKEYILSKLTILLYRLRGGRKGALTAEEDDEELGPEVPVAKASKYYGSFLRSQRLRLRLSGVLLLIMTWISLGLPVTGRFHDTALAALFCLALQLAVMLLCLDVVVKAFTNALRGRFGADFMALLCCIVTSLDALLSSLTGFGTVHLPLCLLSSLSLCGVLLSSYLSCRGLRKALRAPAIAKRSYTVTGETNTRNGEVTLLKSVRPVKGFVRRAEEAAPDETLFQKLGLPLLALVFLLTLIAAAVKRDFKDILYILSVLLCPAIPFTALLAFAIPYAQGSRRLFPSGAAVAGWSGVVDIGQSKNLIVTDRDLFPEGTVEMDTVRIFADVPPERIISYAGSLLCASGCGVSGCFADLMQRKNCPMRQIENFEVLPGGGFKGVIDSSIVLCGSTDLMQLMNVRIPYRLVTRQSVLLAVDGVLYGIFNMKYTPDNRVRSALLGLMRSGRHPVFAIRDFNVTPAMLHDTFEIATDGYDFPPYVERFPMSEGAPGPDSKVAAVVCREGLGPLSDTADFGRRMYVYTRLNLYAAALGAVLGVVLSFFRLMVTGGVGVGVLLTFMLLWSVPALLTGLALKVE